MNSVSLTQAGEPFDLPMNQEAEASLVAALMDNNEIFELVSGIVTAEFFCDDLLGRVFQCCGDLIMKGRKANCVTLADHFKVDDLEPNFNAKRYLADLQLSAFANPATVVDYAKLVRDLYQRRRLISLCGEWTDEARRYDLDSPTADFLDGVAGQINQLVDSGSDDNTIVSMGQAAREALVSVEKAAERGGGLVGLSTGLVDLDNLMGGFEAPDVIILAARPSMGKTALALSMCHSVASQRAQNPAEGGVALMFSLEMERRQIAMRTLSDLTGISVHNMRRGYTSQEQRETLANYCAVVDGLPLYLDDSAGLTTRQIHTRARRHKRKFGLDFIAVDHLGFVRPAKSHGGNRVYQYEEICHDFVEIAKDLQVPVLLLHQLSRGVEARDDKKPVLSDLRDSGALEQDANVVLLLYREEYYLKRRGTRVKPGATANEQFAAEDQYRLALDRCQGVADIICAKQRNGPVDTKQVHFDETTMRFRNLSQSLGERP